MKSRLAEDAPSGQQGSVRAILYSLGANIAIAIAKLGGAALTGSGALLAEAFHSVADSGNEGLLLWGRRQARAPPSAMHPLGHGRATYFWSFIVALLLFSMGGVASIYEGLRKFRSVETLQTPGIALAIIVFAAVAEAVSLYVALKEINTRRGKRSLWRWFRETRRSELIVLFGENAAALAGLGLALAAVLLTMATGNPVYDAIGSMAIGALLVVVALAMGAEIKSLLIGESAAPAVRRAVRTFLSERPEIDRVSDLITLQHGDDVLVAVKAQMRPAQTPRELMEAIRDCEADFRTAFPQVRWVFFEPVLPARSADR
ncbi:MAG: cation diffusion facilitator family transporter [Casimicrobiaceae bacterium]